MDLAAFVRVGNHLVSRGSQLWMAEDAQKREEKEPSHGIAQMTRCCKLHRGFLSRR
jgi:hypothetical protein